MRDSRAEVSSIQLSWNPLHGAGVAALCKPLGLFLLTGRAGRAGRAGPAGPRRALAEVAKHFESVVQAGEVDADSSFTRAAVFVGYVAAAGCSGAAVSGALWPEL